jgi:hypothetical protein
MAESRLSSDSESPFLSNVENPVQFIPMHLVRKRLPCDVIIPWTLFSVLLIALLVQTRILPPGISDSCDPSQYFWAQSEPGQHLAPNLSNSIYSIRAEIVKREIPSVPLQIQVKDGLRWNESKQLFRQRDPDSKFDYAGIPTPEIDAAWAALVPSKSIVV